MSEGDVGVAAANAVVFDELLQQLGATAEIAARRYEEIHRRLVRLFEWRGHSEPERLADITMDRVARKLHAGERIRAEDPYRYFAAVARHVYLEVVRSEIRARRAEAAATSAAEMARSDRDPVARERRIEALEHCLDRLPAGAHELVLDYHRGAGGDRIARRKRLAADLGVALNALRIRVFRLRAQLERCVRETYREE